MTPSEDFIVELGTEELPPLSLEKLAKAFKNNLVSLIDDVNLSHGEANFFATPRRLTIIIHGLALSQEDKTIERQGPAVAAAFDKDGKATPAALGFAKSCHVDVSELNQIDTPKGKRLAYQLMQKGSSSKNLLPDLVEKALSKLPIAKAMRWGSSSHLFIRPVKWLLMLHGSEVIDCTLFDCKSSNLTRGHRFMSLGDIVIHSASEYVETLKQHFVIADLTLRKSIIKQQVIKLADSLNAQAVINEDLLNEVTALVEWPVALAGSFEEDFLSVPQEALITTMASNQKYFHLQNDKQQLINKFITISNIISSDPTVIIKGNEKVIRPRLADAKFFYEQDCKHSLSSKTNKLGTVIFQRDLGSIKDKTLRIQSLAVKLAELQSVDTKNIKRAALICKSDLLTEMVSEFPSLQGIMGQYYAKNDGENDEIAQSMNEIYQPRHSGDVLPSTVTGTYLALADRLDTLVGIFAVGLIPSGNKDPFALRRAALGILRLITENGLTFDLQQLIELTASNYNNIQVNDACKLSLSDFFNARLKAMYLDKGYSNPVIQSVLSLNSVLPCDIEPRLQAVVEFNKLPEASSLSEANKRVANILSKNAAKLDINHVDVSLLTLDAEKAFYQAIKDISPQIQALCQSANYSQALKQLANLKSVIDNFFDSVMVMDEDLSLRQNRLSLLNQLHQLFLGIADIACLQK